jgi:hypothetical protein
LGRSGHAEIPQELCGKRLVEAESLRNTDVMHKLRRLLQKRLKSEVRRH